MNTSERHLTRSKQIFIKTIKGKTLAIDVDLHNDTVSDLSNKILSVDPRRQILTYNGKILSTARTLKSYRIGEHSTIDLSLKLISSLKTITAKGIDLEGEVQSVTKPLTGCLTVGDLLEPQWDSEVVYNENILKDHSLHIQQIANLAEDPIFHAKVGKQFEDAKFFQFAVDGQAYKPRRIPSRPYYRKI